MVPADPRDWVHPPFGAVVDDDGFLWGRGAIDMKNEVAARTVAMASLARSGWRGTGDLLLVIVADEEDGSAEVGMNWLVTERPDIATDYALNEGGGLPFRLGDGRLVVEVAMGEKGTCPVRVDALGEAGHASTPSIGANAVPLLGEVLRRVGQGMPEPADHPAVRSMLDALLGDGAVDRLGLAEAIATAARLHESWEHTIPAVAGITMAPTMLHGSAARNVMPARAGVELDCRILPGTTEAEVLDAVRRRLGDDLAYELSHPEAAVHGNASDPSGPLWDLVAAYEAERTGGVLLPVLCTGLHRLGLPAARVRHVGVRLQPVRLDADARRRGGLPQPRRAGARRRHRAGHRVPRAGGAGAAGLSGQPSSGWTNSPLASLGSNHVDFGGMTWPVSATCDEVGGGGREEHEAHGSAAAVDEALDLLDPADAAHEGDPLVGARVADAEQGCEHAVLQQRDVEAGERVGLVDRAGGCGERRTSGRRRTCRTRAAATASRRGCARRGRAPWRPRRRAAPAYARAGRRPRGCRP